MPGCVSLVRYRTCLGIVSLFHSGTGLTGYRTVRHSGIYILYVPRTWIFSLDTDMQNGHGHGHAAWTRSMDTDMQHGHGHAAWTLIWTCRMDIGIDMQHERGHAAGTQTCSMDTNMQLGDGHAAGTGTCSMNIDMDIQDGYKHGHAAHKNGFVHAAWTWTMDLHGCRNADKKFSPASLVFR
jgi:hypothetical protein